MDKELFKRHIIPMQSAMQTLAERMLGSAEEAEDVVQDVFVRLWEKRNELDKVVKVDSYCMQMVRRRCLDEITKRKKDKDQRNELESLNDNKIMMEVEETRRKSEMLERMMEELPEKQSKILRMKFFEDADTKQMEQALGMSSANVYTTLSRAIDTLRNKLKSITLD